MSDWKIINERKKLENHKFNQIVKHSATKNDK